MRFLIPIRLVSPNVSEHWRVKHKRNKLHAMLIRSELSKVAKPALPCSVTLTRRGVGQMDADNCIYACKPARDTIADWLLPGLAAGRADGDERITWHYKQEQGYPYALIIEINSITS